MSPGFVTKEQIFSWNFLYRECVGFVYSDKNLIKLVFKREKKLKLLFVELRKSVGHQ